MFNGAGHVVKDDEIANFKRLIETN